MDAATETVPSLSGTEWVISSHGHEAVVVEVGGGLRAYRHGTEELVDGYAPGELCPGSAGKVLAPWPNRIRDGRYEFAEVSQQLPITEVARHNAIHGLTNWSRWRLVDQADDAVTVEFDLPPQMGYPWSLTLRTRWSVSAGGLRSDQEVVNTSDRNAPWGFSVHPYLQLPGVAVDDILLHVPGRSRVLADARLLPIGAV